jgi:hypothetical protein
VFTEAETGGLLFQGWTVTDATMLAEVSRHSPKLIRFSYFSGDGYVLEDELVSDAAVAQICSAASGRASRQALPGGA